MCKFKSNSENTKIFNSQWNWITVCANDSKWMLQSDTRNQLEVETNRDCTDWGKNKDLIPQDEPSGIRAIVWCEGELTNTVNTIATNGI